VRTRPLTTDSEQNEPHFQTNPAVTTVFSKNCGRGTADLFSDRNSPIRRIHCQTLTSIQRTGKYPATSMEQLAGAFGRIVGTDLDRHSLRSTSNGSGHMDLFLNRPVVSKRALDSSLATSVDTDNAALLALPNMGRACLHTVSKTRNFRIRPQFQRNNRRFSKIQRRSNRVDDLTLGSPIDRISRSWVYDRRRQLALPNDRCRSD